METRISIEFVFEDFNETPDEITNFLGIKPDEILIKGNILRTKPKLLKVKQNSWTLKSNIDSHQDFEKHLKNIVNKINPSFSKFLELSKKYKPYLICLIKIYDGDRPQLILNSNILKYFSSLSSEIHFDIYNY